MTSNPRQKILDNARYRARQVLPVLRVIKEGSLRGFAVIHPRWAGFGPGDYLSASQAAPWNETPASQIEANAGDFDLRGFEVTRGEFLRRGWDPPDSICTGRRTSASSARKTHTVSCPFFQREPEMRY